MKVFVVSEGCSANFAEGEMIKGLLSGTHEIVDDPACADAAVFNICTVKGDRRSIKNIEDALRMQPSLKLVISGCVTDEVRLAVERISPGVSIVSTNNIDRIREALEAKVILQDKSRLVKLAIPRRKDNPVVGIVPICQGCLDACAYCSTRLSKGILFSYPEQQVVDECRRFVDEGCRELWITAQDTCCYGFDRATDLARLLKKIVEIEGDFMVRVGMGNPRHVKRFHDSFMEIMQHPKIFKFVHIPVQSGSNSVLRRMKRGHTVEDYIELVDSLKRAIPHITVSTDIIVGFPGETDDEFEESKRLVIETRPDVLNISRFIARPGTDAAEMPNRIHGKFAKERSRDLTEVFKSLAHKRSWLGSNASIVITERIKDMSVGRNESYIPVAVDGAYPLGTKLDVEITRAGTHHLKGKVIKQ